MADVVLSKPYTSVNRVKRECHIKQSESNNDNWLKQCVNDASRLAEEMTHREFWYYNHATTALTVKTGWVVSDTVYLPWPIITLTEVAIDDVALDTDDYTYENDALDKGSSRIFRAYGTHWAGYAWVEEGDGISSKYEGNEPSVARDRLFGVNPGPTSYDPTQVTFTLKGTFGYALATNNPEQVAPVGLPFSLVRACTLIAAAMSGLNRKQVMPADGGAAIEVTEYRIPKEAKDLLMGFKRAVV